MNVIVNYREARWLHIVSVIRATHLSVPVKVLMLAQELTAVVYRYKYAETLIDVNG